jgi:hypothetical protein
VQTGARCCVARGLLIRCVQQTDSAETDRRALLCCACAAKGCQRQPRGILRLDSSRRGPVLIQKSDGALQAAHPTCRAHRSSAHVFPLAFAASGCRQGLVPGDEELLSWLRRNNPRPLVLAANKADTRAGSNSA